MKFVKASERLPERSNSNLHLKVVGGENLDKIINCIGDFNTDDDTIIAKNGGVKLSYSGFSLSKIYWLDESEQSEPLPDSGLVKELVSIRNKLYNELPTGEINAFDLITLIKWHINDLDNFCSKLAAASTVSEPITLDWWNDERNLEFINKHIDILCKRILEYDGKGTFASDELQSIADIVYKSKQESLGEDAIGFAEWMKENGVRNSGERHWILEFDPINKIIDPKIYTTEQLYQLFLSH